MPKLPKVSGSEAVRALEKLGFSRSRQRGSHIVLIKTAPDGKKICVIPNHKELKSGTLHDILKQAGVTADEFIKSL